MFARPAYPCGADWNEFTEERVVRASERLLQRRGSILRRGGGTGSEMKNDGSAAGGPEDTPRRGRAPRPARGHEGWQGEFRGATMSPKRSGRGRRTPRTELVRDPTGF